jgi:cytochrome c oxidase subunit IV
MTTITKVLLSVALFLFVVTIVYWIRTSEDAGTVLLGGCVVMSVIIAVFAIRRGSLRHASDAPEDRPDATPADVAGREIGSFPFSSAWPVVFAAGTVFVGVGVLYTLVLLPVGVILGTIAVLGLMRESES